MKVLSGEFHAQLGKKIKLRKNMWRDYLAYKWMTNQNSQKTC